MANPCMAHVELIDKFHFLNDTLNSCINMKVGIR